ncbi:MAG: NifU family protein [bacterium]|nr:NifU family protein [bacterium]
MKFVNKNEFDAKEFETTPAEALEARRQNPAPIIIDVRSPDEFRESHLAGSNNLPAEFLEDNLMQLPPFAPIIIYGTADDAKTAESIQLLRDNGFDEITFVTGGLPALMEALQADPNEVFLKDMPKSEWSHKIEEILDERVRPALAADGGGIVLNKIDEDKVYINYQGACTGCASSSTGTLRFIQNTLRVSLNHPVEVISV